MKGNFKLTLNGGSLSNGQTVKLNLPEEKSYIWDKLDELFSQQKLFKEKIDSKFKEQSFGCYNITQEEYDLLDDISNIIEEAIECRKLINRKRWSEKKKPLDKKALLEELIDVNKFTLQAIIRLGYGAPDMYKAHKEKTVVNDDRQKDGY